MAIQPHTHSSSGGSTTPGTTKPPHEAGDRRALTSTSKCPKASTIGRHIHLPAGRKYPPPSGTTGRDQDPNYVFPPDHRGNVGLVLADGVIGIDVDHYDGKHGVDTMRARVQEWAPLPDTYVSSSRDPQTGSGIWFFRVPAGSHLRGQVGDHVEIVQHTHRYAVVAPSVVEGRAYQWYGPDLAPCTEPRVKDLPELPARWLENLAAVEHASRELPAGAGWRQFVHAHAVIDAQAWAELVEEIPGAKLAPCIHMADIGNPTGLHFAMRRRGAYETLTALMFKAVRFGTGAAVDGCPGGCRGLAIAVQRIAAAYIDEVSNRRARPSSEGGRVEWADEAHRTITRSITGALKRVAG